MILAVSTSASKSSVALLDASRPAPDSVLGTLVSADLQGHAERIFEVLDGVLAQVGQNRDAIDAIACDIGPGSFTGVRVGVASMKGIGLSLNVPVFGVVSLSAMAAAAYAEGVAGPQDVVIAALDAKKGEIFVAGYDALGHALLAPCTRPATSKDLLLSPNFDDLVGHAERRLVIVGDVAAPIGVPEGAHLARGACLDFPDAGWIGRLAIPAVLRGEHPALAALEPLYVRPPDAIPAPGSGAKLLGQNAEVQDPHRPRGL